MNSNEVLCTKCGSSLEKNDQFCGECGQPVEKTVPPLEPEAAKGPTTTQQIFKEGFDWVNKKTSSRSRPLVISLVVVLILGFGAWVGYKRVISRPANVDMIQLLPQAGPSPKQTSPDRSGKIVLGWVGLNIRDVPGDVASRIGMATPSGTLVNACEPGSPADQAGIVPGDVLLQMNGAQLVSARDLMERVAEEPPGKTIKFMVWRNGSIYKASVLVVERPVNVDSKQRLEAKHYASAYEACFKKICPGCNNPLDLFKEQTPQCRQCEMGYKVQIDNCATGKH